jgi:sortase A
MRTKAGIEGTLWAIGLTCAGYLLFVAAQAQVFDRRSPQPAKPDAVVQETPSGAVIGRVEIPGLQLSVAVLEDDESKSLLRGLGHIRGTAKLGGLGTVGLAGHRDTFLRPLRRIEPGMEIRASDSSGVYHYVVDSTEIVSPDRVDVVGTHTRPELTLITCYPFNYVGPAPNRFIVHAHLVSVAPDAVATLPSSR